MHQNRCDFFIYNKKRSLTMKVKLLKFISLQLLWVCQEKCVSNLNITKK